MKNISGFILFLKHILDNRELIKTLVLNDFKKQYMGSYLGLIWAFIQPLSFMLVIWFVFSHGFRMAPTTGGTPFFIWLFVGIIPWFLFSKALASSTETIALNSFLVKKVSFRVSILPIVQICSTILIHFVLIGFLIAILIIYGYFPSIYWLQFLYYLLLTSIFLLGISWFTSAVRVFIKDIGQVITVLLQLGFWGTPIFWSPDMLPEKYKFIIEYNPLNYIISGYRDTFIDHIWFWEKPFLSFTFFSITIVFFVVGAITFKKLRPFFGDAL